MTCIITLQNRAPIVHPTVSLCNLARPTCSSLSSCSPCMPCPTVTTIVQPSAYTVVWPHHAATQTLFNLPTVCLPGSHLVMLLYTIMAHYKFTMPEHLCCGPVLCRARTVSAQSCAEAATGYYVTLWSIHLYVQHPTWPTKTQSHLLIIHSPVTTTHLFPYASTSFVLRSSYDFLFWWFGDYMPKWLALSAYLYVVHMTPFSKGRVLWISMWVGPPI